MDNEVFSILVPKDFGTDLLTSLQKCSAACILHQFLSCEEYNTIEAFSLLLSLKLCDCE